MSLFAEIHNTAQYETYRPYTTNHANTTKKNLSCPDQFFRTCKKIE
ncbi:MAG: hypothetical protein LBE18_11470 [Planctomycetaceae bacterium]|nr:hypothetical protein [Planctomycetaceae bacterium]